MLYNILMESTRELSGTNIDSIAAVAPTSPAYLKEATYTSDSSNNLNISIYGGTHSWINGRACNSLSVSNATLTASIGLKPTNGDDLYVYVKNSKINAHLTGGFNNDTLTYIDKASCYLDNITFDTTSRVVSFGGYIRYIAGNTINQLNVYAGISSKAGRCYAGGYVYGAGSSYSADVRQHINHIHSVINGWNSERYYCRGHIRNYGHFTGGTVTATMLSGNIQYLYLTSDVQGYSVSDVEYGELTICGGTAQYVYLGGSNTADAHDKINSRAILNIEGNPNISYIWMAGMNQYSGENAGDAIVNINTPLSIIRIGSSSASLHYNVQGDTILNLHKTLTVGYFNPAPSVVRFGIDGALVVTNSTADSMAFGNKSTTLDILTPGQRTSSLLINSSGHAKSSPSYWVDNFSYAIDGVAATPTLVSSSSTENRYSLGNYTLVCTTKTVSIE